mgnify:CR=1 FL=1
MSPVRGASGKDQLVRPDIAKDAAHPLIQQVEVEVIVRKAVGQNLHPRHLIFKARKLVLQPVTLGLDLHALEQPVIPLHGGKGEIGPDKQEPNGQDKP